MNIPIRINACHHRHIIKISRILPILWRLNLYYEFDISITCQICWAKYFIRMN